MDIHVDMYVSRLTSDTGITVRFSIVFRGRADIAPADGSM
jgi:hypothetical protein